MTAEDFSQALASRNVYALGVFTVFVLVLLSKKLAPTYYKKIPDGYRWIPPLALAAATGFIDSYYAQLTWKQALIRAGYAVLTMGFGAAGAHGLLKESPLPYGGGPGGKPLARDGGPSRDEAMDSGGLKMAALAVLFSTVLLVVAPVPVMSCSAVKPIANTAHDIAKLWCEAHYKASGKDGVTAEQLCASEKVLRPWIDMVLAGEKNGIEKAGSPSCEPAVER